MTKPSQPERTAYGQLVARGRLIFRAPRPTLPQLLFRDFWTGIVRGLFFSLCLALALYAFLHFQEWSELPQWLDRLLHHVQERLAAHGKMV
ncbi:MAG: hypothetical protein K6G15_03280 [Desulfovibrio sp.]|nr:hypothetical protein [Desulfovibrio sp.]